MGRVVNVCMQSGPAVVDIMLILGQDATVDRLQRALASISANRQSATAAHRPADTS